MYHVFFLLCSSFHCYCFFLLESTCIYVMQLFGYIFLCISNPMFIMATKFPQNFIAAFPFRFPFRIFENLTQRDVKERVTCRKEISRKYMMSTDIQRLVLLKKAGILNLLGTKKEVNLCIWTTNFC